MLGIIKLALNKGFFKKLLANIGLILFLFLSFCSVSHSDEGYKSENQPESSSQFNKSRQKESKRVTLFELFPDVNAAIEVEAVSGGDYTSGVTREVQFDALRIKKFFFQFSIKEVSLFDPSPRQYDNELEYVGLGYETADGRIKAFWDHTCHNPSRKLSEKERDDIHWNEIGMGYETKGMRLGYKNKGITFDSGSKWLNRLNWKASLSRIWMRTENDYEWMFKFGIRDDVYRMGKQVFFFQSSLDSIYDDRGINFNTNLEIGDRISFAENIYLIPFVSYRHFNDWYALGEEENFFSAGLRLEMGLGQRISEGISDIKKSTISWAPKFHIYGGYTNIIENDDFGHSSDIAIDLDLLKLDQNKTFKLNTYAGILTRPHDYNPHNVKYQIGPSLEIDLDHLNFKIFHSYTSLYGLEDEGVIRDYHLLGLGLKNNKTSHWSFDANIGAYPSTKDFDYWGDASGSLGFQLLKEGITPYINGSGHFLQGDDNSLFGHAIEGGMKIPGEKGQCSLYFRYQDDSDVFRFGKGIQRLAGIKFRF